MTDAGASGKFPGGCFLEHSCNFHLKKYVYRDFLSQPVYNYPFSRVADHNNRFIWTRSRKCWHHFRVIVKQPYKERYTNFCASSKKLVKLRLNMPVAFRSAWQINNCENWLDSSHFPVILKTNQNRNKQTNWIHFWSTEVTFFSKFYW